MTAPRTSPPHVDREVETPQGGGALSVAESLKLHAFSEGIRLEPDTERWLTRGGARPLTIHDYVTTSGLILRLPGDVYVNAPLNEPFAAQSPYVLGLSDEGPVLRGPEGEAPAVHVPIPEFLFRTSPAGVLYRNFGITHTDRLRLSPIAGCAYKCRFCDLPYTFAYTTKSPEDLVATARVALDDPVLPARHILISGGTPVAKDREYFERSVRAVLGSVDVPVDVMMVPWAGVEWIERFQSLGVRRLFLNLEMYDATLARSVMPQKSSRGLAFYLDAVEAAARVFGRGGVSSLILVGLEPTGSTLRGVTELARRGCTPVLSPFRPSADTPLANHSTPAFSTLQRVHAQASEICRENGLRLGPECLACQHNTLTLPADGSA